jgi:hypothetical protein
MTDSTKAPIPEDLQEDYDHYRKYMKCAVRVDTLIERIAALEAERDMWKAEASRLDCDKKRIIEIGEQELSALRAENERLKAPVSDEETACVDCHRPYPHGLDMVLTKKQWLMVHPDDGGVLCPSCIVNRASNLPGAISIFAHILTSDNFEPVEGVPETMLQAMRLENADYCREAAELRYQLAALRAENAALKAPVSDEEWTRFYSHTLPRYQALLMDRNSINLLIAARASTPKSAASPEDEL